MSTSIKICTGMQEKKKIGGLDFKGFILIWAYF